MIAYKLFRKMKDGYAPLFINKRQRLEVGVEYQAEDHPTKGFAHRPGWHVCKEKNAPHLTEKGRVWCKVFIKDYTEMMRPESQGGLWYLAQRMFIIEEMGG